MRIDRSDFVRIKKEDSPYFDLTGSVHEVTEDGLIVEIYGDFIQVSLDDVYLTAKFMTRDYMRTNRIAVEWHTENLKEEDVRQLIDLALDLKDYVWAKQLSAKLPVN